MTEIIKLTSGKKLHELEKYYPPKEARTIRMKYIEHKLHQNFPNINKTGLQANKLYKKNIENYIGSVEIPIGIAGPLKLNGDYAKGDFYIPLATTEGTLVASTNRGAKVTSQSGGIILTSEYIGATRAPLLRTSGIIKSREVSIWIEKNFSDLAVLAQTNEKYIKLLKIECFAHGKNLWLRMNFDTNGAMGMNMATKAANYLSQEIVKQNKGVELLTVSGNMCADKKPTVLNIISGRGRRVRAETIIKKEILKRYFRTTAKKIALVNKNKVWEGTAISGGISYNAHFANIIAAAYCACGQDLAHVVDSSLGYCTMEDDDGDLYISITLSCMMLGTIGGGTRLPKQFEAQNLMLSEINTGKMTINNRTHTMAEIIAGAVLCGELSLHAALTTNEHIKAHDNLGGKLNENN